MRDKETGVTVHRDWGSGLAGRVRLQPFANERLRLLDLRLVHHLLKHGKKALAARIAAWQRPTRS